MALSSILNYLIKTRAHELKLTRNDDTNKRNRERVNVILRDFPSYLHKLCHCREKKRGEHSDQR